VTQWFELTREKVLERDLQELFDSWPQRDASRLFGVPDWLNAIGVPPLEKKERQRRAFGYDFTPDIEFIVGRLRYVLELKHGDKYEPLMGASDRPVLLWEGWAARRGEVWRLVRSPDGRLDANGSYFLSGVGNTQAQATHSSTWLAAEAS
jgi:hypothetical protein